MGTDPLTEQIENAAKVLHAMFDGLGQADGYDPEPWDSLDDAQKQCARDEATEIIAASGLVAEVSALRERRVGTDPNLMADDNEELTLDQFMLGVLLRQWWEAHDANRVDYHAALDWVLDGWRSEDDPKRKELTEWANALAPTMASVPAEDAGGG